MNWVIWASFAAVSAVNIVTPGPANLNTVRRTVQFGGKRVVPTIMGNALGLAAGGVVCALGVTNFVMASGLLWSLFQWLGIAYLGWLGLKLLIGGDTPSLTAETQPSVSARALFSEAFLLAATNPKALLFYVALFPQVLRPESGLPLQASILILTYCGLSVLSLSAYSALAHALRTHFMTQKRYERFRRASGIILLGFAFKLFMGLGDQRS